MKKGIFAGAVALIMTVTTVSAEELKWVDCSVVNDGTVIIERNLESRETDANVSMLVYYPGKTFEELTKDNVMDIIAKSDQVISKADGKYTFEFKLGGVSDFYTVEISSDAADFETFKILYSNPQEAKPLISELNTAAGNTQFYDLLYGEDEGWKKVGFYLDLKSNINLKNVSDILFKSVQDEKFNETDIQSAELRFNKAYMIELLNQGESLSLVDLENYLQINSAECAEYYNKDYIKDENKEEIFDNLKKKNLMSENEYSDAFLEQVILKTVEKASGYGNIRDVLVQYSQKTGINTDNLSSAAYRNVMGNLYDNYKELKDALNKKGSTTQGGGSGGSSGGGKNTGSVGIKNVSLPVDAVKTPEPIPVEKTYFDDLKGYEWAKEPIEYLAEEEFITGKADRLFFPQDSITREEFTKILVNALRISGEETESVFTDVESGTWYAKSIRIAAGAGIVTGKQDGTFGIGEKITRQDMAVMIARARKLEGEDKITELFADDAQISDYAKSSVYAAKDAGIVSGVGNNIFNPLGFATRAEAAMMIYNAIK